MQLEVSDGTDSSSKTIEIEVADAPPVIEADTTAPVTFVDIDGGTYNSVQTVLLSCDDGDGSGCAVIYYTTDGSDPSISSTQYSAPITIAANTTLKFFATDLAGNEEAVSTKVYTIDSTPPEADTTAPVTSVDIDSGTYNSVQTVLLTCDDGDGSGCVAIYYTTDGSEPTIASSTYENAITINQTTTLKFFSIDNAGNKESILTKNYTIDITVTPDLIAPISSATPGGGNFASAALVELTCNDEGGAGCNSIYYTVDGSEPTETSAKYVTPININSDMTLKFFAVDNAGNKEPINEETYVFNGSLMVDVSTLTNPVVAGERVLYNITVSNISETQVDDVVVSFLIPAELSFVFNRDAVPDASGCSSNGICNPTQEIFWNLETLVAGESRTISVNAFVNIDLLDNAIITTLITVRATNVDNITINKLVEINNTRSAELSLSASADPVTPNETFTFNLVMGNTGGTPLNNVQLHVRLPVGVNIDDRDGGTEVSPGEVVWEIGEWGVSTSLSRDITVTADSNRVAGEILRATSWLTYDGGLAIDNIAEHVVTVVSNALPLNLDISTSANPVVAGERVLYTLTLSNTSLLPVDDVLVVLRIPAELSFVFNRDVAPDASGCSSNGTCNPAQEIFWNLGQLVAGENRTITIDALVNSDISSGNLITTPIRITAAGLIDVINLVNIVSVAP